MSSSHRLRVTASLDQIRYLCQRVVEAAEALGLSDKATYHCEVATEEACANIVQYGNATWIEVETRADSEFLTIIVVDDGGAFNPLDHDTVDLSDEESKLEPGGLGIHFVTHLMDELGYTYLNGQNQLILRKRLS